MKIVLLAILLAASGSAAAQSTSTGQATSGSEAGANAQTGPITFEAAQQRGRISTTPSSYTPPSMFGGANNYGMSNTVTAGLTGLTGGFSRASESDACNAREDTAILYKLGFQEVAKMRFVCFGSAENRQAFEATGGVCPTTATARGLDGNVTAASYAP